jgi:phage baseplate assembly protein gpV
MSLSSYDSYRYEFNEAGFFLLQKLESLLGTAVAKEGAIGHGFSKIVFTSSGSATIYRADDVLNQNSVHLTTQEFTDVITSIETAMGTAGDLSTFLPADGEEVVVNLEGLHIVRSSPTEYSITMYTDTTWAVVKMQIILDKTNDRIRISHGSNILELNGTELNLAGDFTIVGDFTHSGGTFNSNGFLEVIQ